MRVLACVAAALAPVALGQSNSLFVEDAWLDTGYDFVFPVGVCSQVFTQDSLTSGDVTSVEYVCTSDEATKYECPDAACADVTQCTETILNPAQYNYNCNGASNYGQIGAYINACSANADGAAATVSVATGVCTYLPVLGGYGEAACTSAGGGSITRYTDADCTTLAAPSTVGGFTLDTVVTLANGECKQVAEVPITGFGTFPLMLRLDNCQNMDETPAPVDTPAPVVPQTPAPVVPQTPSPDTVLTPSPVDPTTAEPTFINERCDEDTDYYYEVDLSVTIDSKGIRFPNKRNFTRELCNMTVYQQTVEETLQIDIAGLPFSIVLDVELCILLTNIDCNYDEKTLDFDVKIEVSRELYLYGVFANMLGLGVDDIAGLFLQYCGPRRGAGRLSRRLANIINNIDVHDYEHGCIDPDNTDCVDIRGNSVVLAAPQLVAGLLTGGVVGAV